MKKLFLVFNLLVGILTLFAYPVRIESWHIRDDVKRLNAMNISVDYVNPATQTIIAYVHDDAEFSSLLNSGFQAEQITSADRKYANFIVPNPDETGNQSVIIYLLLNTLLLCKIQLISIQIFVSSFNLGAVCKIVLYILCGFRITFPWKKTNLNFVMCLPCTGMKLWDTICLFA